MCTIQLPPYILLKDCWFILGVIESCPHLPAGFIEEVDKTRIYYQGIEFNPAMSREEKIPFMIEWWHKAQERLVQTGLKREFIEEAVTIANLYLRYLV